MRVTLRPPQRKKKSHSLLSGHSGPQVLCNLLWKPYFVGKTMALFSQPVMHLSSAGISLLPG